jgi:hypothetical protein
LSREAIQHVGEEFGLSLRKQAFALSREIIGEGGCPDPTLLPPVVHNPFSLELLQMVADGIEGQAQFGGQVPSSKQSSAFQLQQKVPPGSMVGRRQGAM